MPERLRPLAVVAATLGAILALPALADAQWWLEGSYGGVESQAIASDLTTNSLMIGLVLEGDPWFGLNAGAPVDSAGAAWASLAAGGELVRSGVLDVGITGSAQSWAYGGGTVTSGWGLLAEALPLVRASLGVAQMELGTGAVHYRGDGDNASVHSRTLSSTRASIWAASDIGDVGAAFRYVAGPDGGYAYAGGSASAQVGPVALWVRAGTWFSDAIPKADWTVGAHFYANDRLRLDLSARQSTNDPILWSQPRRSWNIGVSYSFGRSAGAPPTSVPTNVSAGTVRFSLPVDDASDAPAVAGDFSQWRPVSMVRAGRHWIAEVNLPPGVYHYSFQTADGDWFLPEGILHRVDDGFGGENAVLVVQ